MSYYNKKPRTLLFQHKDENIAEVVTHSFAADGLTIYDLLEKFKSFVAGIGYHVDGEFIYKTTEEQEDDDAYYERRSALDDKKDEQVLRMQIQIDELVDQLNNGNKVDLDSSDSYSDEDSWECICGDEDSDEISEETKATINECLENMKAAATKKTGEEFFQPEENHAPRCF